MPWLAAAASAIGSAAGSAASAIGSAVSGAAGGISSALGSGAGSGAAGGLLSEAAVPISAAEGGGLMSAGAPLASAPAGGMLSSLGASPLGGMLNRFTGVDLGQIGQAVPQGGGDWLGSTRGFEAGLKSSPLTTALQQIANRDFNASQLLGSALQAKVPQALNFARAGQSLGRGLNPMDDQGRALSSESAPKLLQRLVTALLGERHPGTFGYQQ